MGGVLCIVLHICSVGRIAGLRLVVRILLLLLLLLWLLMMMMMLLLLLLLLLR